MRTLKPTTMAAKLSIAYTHSVSLVMEREPSAGPSNAMKHD